MHLSFPGRDAVGRYEFRLFQACWGCDNIRVRAQVDLISVVAAIIGLSLGVIVGVYYETNKPILDVSRDLMFDAGLSSYEENASGCNHLENMVKKWKAIAVEERAISISYGGIPTDADREEARRELSVESLEWTQPERR